jgi:hypothetical protein
MADRLTPKHREQFKNDIDTVLGESEIFSESLMRLRLQASRGGLVRKCLDCAWEKLEGIIMDIENAEAMHEAERTGKHE